LSASKRVNNDYFGNDFAVAISKNRIVVGAYGNNNFQGAAYVYGDSSNPQSGRSYSELFILTASDGDSDHWFGESVAIDGDSIVVGARYAPGNDNQVTGAVYVYQINEDSSGKIISIPQVAKLTASDGKFGDFLGASVAILGNSILVGATGVNIGNVLNAGAAYWFGYISTGSTPSQWTLIQQILPNELIENAQFGYSVAMDDNIAVIGSFFGNAAFVFAPENPSSSLSSAWDQIAKVNGPTNSRLGSLVAVAGSRIAVGAFSDDNIKGTGAGAVYVYSKTSSSSSPWTQVTQLLAADGAPGDNFGRSVDISKNASTIVVGANSDDFSDSTTTATNSRAAFLFRATISTTTAAVEWTQMGKFVAADRASTDQLGMSIAIEDNIVVVGAWGDDTYQGSAYVEVFHQRPVHHLVPSRASFPVLCPVLNRVWSRVELLAPS
jgi:hypothetical protein